MSDKSEKEHILEYLATLRLAAYTSFNDRRSYEWKLSLAIWTALSVLIAGLVQSEKFPFQGKRYGIAATIVGLVVIYLHAYFNNGIARANGMDRTKVRLYEKAIKSILTDDYGVVFDQSIQRELRKRGDTLFPREFKNPRMRRLQVIMEYRPERRNMQWRQWGHVAQIGVSVGLVGVIVAIVWIKALR